MEFVSDDSTDLDSTFSVRPFLDKSFGAEIIGANLASLTDEQVVEINQALLTYKFIVFREQDYLTVEDQRSFSLKFGPLFSHVQGNSHHPVYPDVNIVSNMSDTPKLIGPSVGALYHSDMAWFSLPTKFTMLRSVVSPRYGGATSFANSTEAYDALPEDWKQRLDGLTANYSYMRHRDSLPGVEGDDLAALKKGVHHPVVIAHPETGAKSIYVNPGFTVSIDNVSSEESTEILEFLFAHYTQPKFVYSHYYKDGDLVMWDNRALQHSAPVEASGPRKLIRTTIHNDSIPVPSIDKLHTFVVHRMDGATTTSTSD